MKTSEYEQLIANVARGAARLPMNPPVQRSNKTKQSKYRNDKIIVDGFKFDSKKESNRYLELKSNHTRYLNLELQKSFSIEVCGQHICKYIADFYYYDLDDSQWVVEDVKSAFTRKLPVYRLKKKLMEAVHNVIIKEI